MTNIHALLHYRLVKNLKENMKIKDTTKDELLEYWDVIKVHEICHFPRNIERSGATQHYNAELYENLHQKV